jgi:AraC-like DNA-binding protein
MRKVAFWFALFLMFFSFISLSASPVFLSPKPYTVINGNYIKFDLKVDSLPDSVCLHTIFATSHNETLDSSIHQWTKPPYDFIMNCLNIPDQTWMQVYAVAVYDNRRDSSRGAPGFRHTIPVFLDRNTALNPLNAQSVFIKDNSPLPKYWTDAPTYQFKSSSNEILWQSLWNRDSLFFRVKIWDAFIVVVDSPKVHHLFDTIPSPLLMIYQGDFIEFCFDLKCNHNVIREMDDMEILIDPEGRMSGHAWDFKQGLFRNWGKSANVRVKKFKNASSTDSLWIVTLAVPWSALSHDVPFRPEAGKQMGFDLISGDADKKASKILYYSWSGVEYYNNDNPSEWANLVLVKKIQYAKWILVVLGVTGFMVLLVMVVFRIKPGRSQSRYSRRMQKILALIDENCTDKSFNRQVLARKMGIHEDYLSRIVKKEYGENLVTLINARRIAIAKSLLKDYEKNISTISFEVGFNSVDAFTTAFKKITGKNPSEYRE